MAGGEKNYANIPQKKTTSKKKNLSRSSRLMRKRKRSKRLTKKKLGGGQTGDIKGPFRRAYKNYPPGKGGGTYRKEIFG